MRELLERVSALTSESSRSSRGLTPRPLEITCTNELIGGYRRLGLICMQLAQGLGNFVQKGPSVLLAGARRRHNRIGTMQTDAIGTAFSNLAGPANRTRPVFTGMNQQSSGGQSKIHGEPPGRILVQKRYVSHHVPYRFSGAELKRPSTPIHAQIRVKLWPICMFGFLKVVWARLHGNLPPAGTKFSGNYSPSRQASPALCPD